MSIENKTTDTALVTARNLRVLGQTVLFQRFEQLIFHRELYMQDFHLTDYLVDLFTLNERPFLHQGAALNECITLLLIGLHTTTGWISKHQPDTSQTPLA